MIEVVLNDRLGKKIRVKCKYVTIHRCCVRKLVELLSLALHLHSVCHVYASVPAFLPEPRLVFAARTTRSAI